MVWRMVGAKAVIWTIAGILLTGLLGTHLSEILIKIQTFSFTKMHFKMSSGKWRPFCLGLNVIMVSLCSGFHFRKCTSQSRTSSVLSIAPGITISDLCYIWKMWPNLCAVCSKICVRSWNFFFSVTSYFCVICLSCVKLKCRLSIWNWFLVCTLDNWIDFIVEKYTKL